MERRGRREKRKKKITTTPPKKKEKETSGAALRYADARRGRVTRSAYVRKIGWSESQDGGIHFLGFSHSTFGTECLARRKPALHRRTEYPHNRAIPRIHTHRKRFPKRVVFLLLSALRSDSSDGRTGVVNAATFRRSQFRGTHEFQNCRHCRHRWFFLRDTHAYICPCFYSECLQRCYSVVRRVAPKMYRGYMWAEPK